MYIENKFRITGSQFEKLSKEQKILKEIEELRADIKEMHKYYCDKISELEKLLKV